MGKEGKKYYENQAYLLFVVSSLLYKPYYKTTDMRIRKTIKDIIIALDVGDLKDEDVLKFALHKLMILGVNESELSWFVASAINWCNDFNKGDHYPIEYEDKIDGDNANIEGLDGDMVLDFISELRTI